MADISDPLLSPSEIASRRAGYITDSLTDPLTASGLERLDRERNIFRATKAPAEAAAAKRTLRRQFGGVTILARITGYLRSHAAPLR